MIQIYSNVLAKVLGQFGNVPGVHQVCIGVCTRCAPGGQWYITKLPVLDNENILTVWSS